MGEAKKRKVHSPELKAKVGLEALRGVESINEIGQEYDVYPFQVGQWKKGNSGAGEYAIFLAGQWSLTMLKHWCGRGGGRGNGSQAAFWLV